MLMNNEIKNILRKASVFAKRWTEIRKILLEIKHKTKLRINQQNQIEKKKILLTKHFLRKYARLYSSSKDIKWLNDEDSDNTLKQPH